MDQQSTHPASHVEYPTQENNRMDMLKVTEQARALLDAHGDKAEAEAAQKAAALKADGKTDEANQWEKVRKAIHELRSGHVS
jgi:hypothetical protein